MTPVIDVTIEAEEWASLEAPSQLAEDAILAAIGERGVLFCDDGFIRDLTREWRGIDQPANVLSFPAGGDAAFAPLLGDIIIAFETASREATEAGRPLRDHVVHLLVHGFLHLIGHDHFGAAEAETVGV